MNLSSSSDTEKHILETPTISIDSNACVINDEDAEDLAASGDSKSNKHGTVTLDVTKALLLLGFTSWSAVEEGVDADNKEQMKSKLADIVKNLIKERQEYHALIEETKELNYELYKMMISADENHSGALYKSDVLSTTPEENCSSKSDQTVSSEEKELPVNKTTKRKGSENTSDLTPEKDSHLRRTKSEKVRKRSFKKAGRVATATVKAKTIISKDNKKVSEVDKESESLLWAERIIMKEYVRRNELRKKSTIAVKKANSKLETLNAFKQLLSVMKQDIANKTDGNENSTTTNNGSHSSEPLDNSNTMVKEVETKIAANLTEISQSNLPDKSQEDSSKDEPAKLKVKIISLRDQIETKKLEAPDAASVLSYHKDKFQSTNEKDKIKEAKKFLFELRERLERKRLLSNDTTDQGLSPLNSVGDEEDEEVSIDQLVKKADLVRSVWGKKVGLINIQRKSTTPKESLSSNYTSNDPIADARDNRNPSEELEDEMNTSNPTNEDEVDDADDVFEENISDKSDAVEEENEDLK